MTTLAFSETEKSHIRGLIEQRSIPVPESGCWLWTASAAASGYGDFRAFGKRHFLAHRASYAAFKGEIPSGQHVLHRCDVRCCVNPEHLSLGSNQDNIADSVMKGRRKGVTRARPTGLKYKPMSASGRAAHWKYPKELRESITAMLSAGKSRRAVAKEFGMSDVTVGRIAREAA